jgi:AcrR family transcriptional regulator
MGLIGRLEKTSSSIAKDCMAESLLILMRKKAFSDITISEITKKAGVNRSSYYRNFKSKGDIVKYSFIKIFFEYAKNNNLYEYVKNKDKKNIPYRKMLSKLFIHFLTYKNELMLIYKNGLSHYILEDFNERAISIFGQKSFEEQYKAYWHIGGIYNTFLLWFSTDMAIPVEKITELFLANIPKNI